MTELDDQIQKYEKKVRDIIFYDFNALLHDDDAFQEGRIGVWKALTTYDENKGMSLENYIHKYVKWSLGVYLKKKKKEYTDEFKQIELPAYTLDLKYSDDPKKDDNDPFDILIKNNSTEEHYDFFERINENNVINHISRKEIEKCLNDNQKKVFRMLLNGYTFSEISRKLKVSRQRVHQITKQIINRSNNGYLV